MICVNCGSTIPEGATRCEVCGQEVSQPAVNMQTNYYAQGQTYTSGQTFAQGPYIPAEKKENVVTGIVGAILGAVIGGAFILILSRLGFVASISGLILAVCTLKGYELLGRKLGVVGVIVSFILIAVTPYVADRIDWAIIVLGEYGDYGMTFANAFDAIPDLVKSEIIDKGDYIINLVKLYVFAAVGAFSILISFVKRK